jgi:4'-phosphopantetheinyl transferase
MPPQDLQIPEWTPSPPANPDLGPKDVHLWRVPVDAGRPPGLITRSATLLSPDERERADRYKFPADAGRFILCRAALRILLGRYTNAAPQTISISCGPFGKPMLTGSSDSPDRPSPEFNVSHSGSYALLGFSRDHPLGLDLERLRQMPDIDALVERFFSPAEREEYRALPPGQRTAGFFNGWTRKEAIVKALGEGLSRPLDSFDVTLSPAEPARLLRIGSARGAETGWSLLSFAPATGYVAATAIEGSRPVPTFLEFRFD